MAGPKSQKIMEEIDEFMAYLRKRFEPGEGEVTIYVRNKKFNGTGDLLMTTDEFSEIVPGIQAHIANNS